MNAGGLALLLLAVAFGVVARARAEVEPSGYAEAVEQAVQAYNAASYRDAVEAFARAHALFPNARTAKGLGMAEFHQGAYVDSVDHLEQALVSEVLPLEGESRREAERLLARGLQRVSRVRIDKKPRETVFTVDGGPAREGPTRAVLLDPGAHYLELSAPGYRPVRRNLLLRPGDEQTLHIALEPLPSPSERGRPLVKNPWLWGGITIAVAGVVLGALALRGRLGPDQPDDGLANHTFVAPP